MAFKKPVIALILFFAVVFCFGVPSAEAQFWPFGKNKQQDNAAAGKTWPKKPLQEKAEGKDVVVNGMTIKGLKEEMMYSSYAPKSAEEIGAIALAHNSWHAGTIKDMRKAAEERMAAAQLRSEQGLTDLQAGKYAQPAPVMNAQGSGVNGVDQKPATKQIYNKPILTKPSKVFTDYR